ncbi:DNA/RNA non-specific endonuclease [Pseudomonas syringae]|uniref:DNA/RNA non-specific endonuclease n=1 Tax=Pseudomonas syringae TaxID=317 RepID=UPI00195E8B63
MYKVDGNKVYQTDELGRVDKVESSLSLNRNDRNTHQQCVAGKCGIDGDEGGHLIASIFNGPGVRLNLLLMNGNLNKGVWKFMENKWASALKEGKSVDVKVEPVYNGQSVRPEKFAVTYKMGSERLVRET